MQKVLRQVFIEILWLILSSGLTTFLALSLFGKSLLSSTIDIHLHDTYFVILPFHILLPLFCMVTFIVYFIKEFRKSFRRTLPNWILIIIGLTLIIALTFLIKTLSQFFTGDWTLYPPLSALGPDKISKLAEDPMAKFVTSLFIGIQIVILLMLLYCVYRWGTQNSKTKKLK